MSSLGYRLKKRMADWSDYRNDDGEVEEEDGEESAGLHLFLKKCIKRKMFTYKPV